MNIEGKHIAITACVIAAAWVATNGKSEWVWFLLIGFLMS
jgi:hypothetical protein